MKLDIENKILIPFMILAAFPIMILGIFSFWNGYQLLLNNTSKHLEASLDDTIAYIEIAEDKALSDDMTAMEGRQDTIDHLKRIKKENLIITSNGVVLLNNTMISQLPDELFSGNEGEGFLNTDNNLFYYRNYPAWDWTVIISADKQLLVNELLDIQKYILLMAIIFLVISMQSIIFIAHNISKPIKYFAEVCKKIGINNLNKVTLNRSDEIGILANSFNKMIDQLNDSTESLMEMKKFNEDILENIFIGIMTADTEGNLLSINNAGKQIFESRYDSAAIRNALNGQIQKTLTDRRSISSIATVAAEHDGSIIYLDVSTSLLKKDADHITGAICSFSDITGRKNLENNYVRVNRLAYVGQFAAGLAHEIRNPLTGIKTSIQVIRNRLQKEQDRSSLELAEGIIYEIDRINRLITDLLDFSKIKRTDRQKSELINILRKSIDLVSEEIERKQIDVQLRSYTDAIDVLVDPGQAEQVFLNIITNALQSMDAHGKLKILVDKDPEEPDNNVRISFEDTGSGIDSGIREKIFDPFFTTKPKGTGLGLSVVARLLEENGGYLELESTQGEGSTFKVYLHIIRGDIQ